VVAEAAAAAAGAAVAPVADTDESMAPQVPRATVHSAAAPWDCVPCSDGSEGDAKSRTRSAALSHRASLVQQHCVHTVRTEAYPAHRGSMTAARLRGALPVHLQMAALVAACVLALIGHNSESDVVATIYSMGLQLAVAHLENQERERRLQQRRMQLCAAQPQWPLPLSEHAAPCATWPQDRAMRSAPTVALEFPERCVVLSAVDTVGITTESTPRALDTAEFLIVRQSYPPLRGHLYLSLLLSMLLVPAAAFLDLSRMNLVGGAKMLLRLDETSRGTALEYLTGHRTEGKESKY
jgi:hypothetical protein